ncbi:hypothetical protein OHA02_38690 [Streptomyces phaeochromogenes]|nr:hypothetical protein [Streptomyces phaeochromogenes]
MSTVATPDADDRRHQHRLAADPVTEPAEEQGAQRAGHETDGEGGERRHGRGEGVVRDEVLHVEHDRRGRREQEEVVPLHGGADERGNGHATRDGAVGGRGICRLGGGNGGYC